MRNKRLVSNEEFLEFIINFKHYHEYQQELSFAESLKLTSNKKENLRRTPNKLYDLNNKITDKFTCEMYLMDHLSLTLQNTSLKTRRYTLTENKQEYIDSKSVFNKVKYNDDRLKFILSLGSRRCLKIKPLDKKTKDINFDYDLYIGHYDIIVLSPNFHLTHKFTTKEKNNLTTNAAEIFCNKSFYICCI
jgi:hypothetical protein